MENDLIREYYNLKKNGNKDKDNRRFNVSRLISKILLSVIFLLVSIIVIKSSNKGEEWFTNIVFKEQFNFTKFNEFYKKYFGNLGDYTIPSETQSVFNEGISYKELDKYLNGVVLTVDKNYVVPAINSGIVVYIGNKDSLGNTLIVQGVDGVDVWYSNVSVSDLNLYDYVSKDTNIGVTLTDKLYITLEKDGSYLNYEDYKV